VEREKLRLAVLKEMVGSLENEYEAEYDMDQATHDYEAEAESSKASDEAMAGDRGSADSDATGPTGIV
jgi:hypothetical protein